MGETLGIFKRSEESVLNFMKKDDFDSAILVLQHLKKESGVVNKKNEINYIKCLMKKDRFDDAFVYLKNMMKKDPTDTDYLHFYGICCYHLDLFQEAFEAFSNNSVDNRWKAKCEFMLDVENKKSVLYEIGSYSPSIPPQIDWSQDEKLVYINVYTKVLSKNEIVVNTSPFSVDISIFLERERVFMRSFELFGRIKSEQYEININNEGFTVILVKNSIKNWESLEEIVSDEQNVDTVIANLPLIPELTDEEVEQQFEKSHQTE